MVKVGLFGIGLDTYWEQFDGLLDNLIGYQKQIKLKIEENNNTLVIDAGMIDNWDKASKAANLLIENDIKILFLYVSTYALSSIALRVVQKLKVPVVILNIQPVAQLNYETFNEIRDRGKMTGIWLQHCQACSVPELASVFKRSGISFDFVTGYLNDPEVWNELQKWCSAANVSEKMRSNCMGILGHYYGGMLDVYTDLTKQSATFGTHFEFIEMCELKKYRDEVTDKEVQNKLEEFNDWFEVDDECDSLELERAARTSVTLDKLVETYQLGSMAYYYEGESGNDYENIITSIIAGNTILTGNGIPVSGECEIKNAQAMKIMSEFGAGGSFSEFYLIDYIDNIIFFGHDGPAHSNMAEGRVKLVPLPIYHGKPGKGLSIQMSVKYGKVTLLSVVENKEGITLLVAEGESVPGDVLQIGNTNSRYQFPLGVKSFVEKWAEEGPSHHIAIGIGHIADYIKKFAKITGVKMVQIC